ncbi:MAG: C10 family peptidase, partial [Candidatus Cloacimonetes bacterium]|nr:C10 family peptidase [Candidatus Cloacimonadota bacterium]
MKRLIVSIVLLILVSFAAAGLVNINTAAAIGSGYFGFRSGVQHAEYEIDAYFGGGSTNPDLYIMRFQPQGFVLLAAEAQATPILGYDLASVFPEGELPAHISWYLQQYSLSIQEIRNHPEWAIDPQWEALLQEDYSAYQVTRNVAPILTTTWDQDWPYNSMCPTDGSGSGGHVLVGSIPTAMGQVMKRWNQPVHGTGSHSYNCPGYGNQSANFGATTYNWDAMPNSTTTVNTAISTLLYHCGVAVDTQYSPTGSGAYPEDVLFALEHYFGYHTAAELLNASAYNASTWATMLRGDLNLGRPVYYGGTSTTVGHAFVLDGYSGTNYFHVNWGWGGLYDGYFYLNNLNPGSESFNLNQRAIMHIYHPAVPYHDLACTSLTGPNSGWVNLPYTFTASVTNEGMVTQTAYSVRLMRDGGILLDSVAGTALISSATRTFELSWTPPAAGNYSLYAEVLLAPDTNPDNDISPTLDFSSTIQDTDPPTNVTATDMGSTSVNISWTAPSARPDLPSRVLLGYRVWRLFSENQSDESTWIGLTPNPLTVCTYT